jgi:hypothetical protein
MHNAEVAAFVLVVMTVAGIVAGFLRPKLLDLPVALILVVASAVWLDVNGPLEGKTLKVLSPTHGVTSGDLLAIPALTLAVALGLRWTMSWTQRGSIPHG